MKTKIMMVCVALFFNIATGFAQKSNGFVLTGQFKGLPDGTKVYLRTQEKDTIAKTISKGDQFIFRVKPSLEGRFYFIVFDTLISNVKPSSMLLENKAMRVTGELGKGDIVLKGSQSDLDNKEFFSLMTSVRTKNDLQNKIINEIKYKLSTSVDSVEKAELKRKEEVLKGQLLQGIKNTNETALNWMMTHNNSFYTPFVIIGYTGFFNPDEMKKLYNNLTPAVKAGYYANQLKSVVENVSKIAEGNIIPDFMLATPEGKKISVLELAAKNSYTLIDCWASWCSPCRAEVPALKEIYAAYKSKGLGIVGVSSDKDIAKWKKAVIEDATPWSHVVESEKSEFIRTFDLRGIPAYMLIDDKGRLVAFDCHSSIKPFGGRLRGEGLKKTLEGLLGK
jgi:thiol-disulfide isomerase/thioredoxin